MIESISIWNILLSINQTTDIYQKYDCKYKLLSQDVRIIIRNYIFDEISPSEWILYTNCKYIDYNNKIASKVLNCKKWAFKELIKAILLFMDKCKPNKNYVEIVWVDRC